MFMYYIMNADVRNALGKLHSAPCNVVYYLAHVMQACICAYALCKPNIWRVVKYMPETCALVLQGMHACMHGHQAAVTKTFGWF